jgi:Malate:quinone oxidoreductase (Mqo)
MSATLAVIYEVLGSEAQESSNAWNNAGTGHAALCELNYTPQESNGSVGISKALEVNTEFDLSRQLWAYLGWLVKLKEMIPSYGQSLIENGALCRQVRAETAVILNINNIEDITQ